MNCQTYGCRETGNKVGVLLAQLGTPEAPTKEALKPYLKEFLSDSRVIEKNRALWWLILNGIVLRTRPKRSAALYERIWTDEGSPLLVITKKQTAKLREKLQVKNPTIEVEFGMRYGEPSIASAIDSLLERGVSRLLVFNMYPQYSATTTGSNCDSVFRHLMTKRNIPAVRICEPYYNNVHYVEPLVRIIEESYEGFDKKPEKLVLSYHGIPEEYISKGDPYCCQCTETTEALLKTTKIPAKDIIHTFQSRFGRDPWLVPYTDETIAVLAKSGVKHIAVACPGFTADCLETLDEIGNEAREEFTELGGERLDLIPCLNDHELWIAGLEKMVTAELGSWLEDYSVAPKGVGCFQCPTQCEKRGESWVSSREGVGEMRSVGGGSA